MYVVAYVKTKVKVLTQKYSDSMIGIKNASLLVIFFLK